MYPQLIIFTGIDPQTRPESCDRVVFRPELIISRSYPKEPQRKDPKFPIALLFTKWTDLTAT